MPPLMLGTDTMAVLTDITDTVMDTDTDTTVKKLLWNVISCHFLNNPPLELSKPTLLPSAILLKLCFFMKKLLQNSYLDPIVIINSQKMPLSKKRDLCNIIRTTLWL